MSETLQQLHEQNKITALDFQFTRWLSQQAAEPSAQLALGACLLSQATGNGHVCLHLPSQANRHIFTDTGLEIRTPIYSQWRNSLLQSGVVGHPGDRQPLILDAKGRLYLYRYWEYEQRLQKNLLTRAEFLETVDINQIRLKLHTLFSDSQADIWPKVAVATALLRRLCIISGGPGTGKTTTVVKLLALLQSQQQDKPLRIRLVAPTGKAAARLQESITQARHNPALATHLAELSLPEQASTIHRLLVPQPDSVYFRYHADNPLPLDVLVLDEASMVDLALMTKLLDALPVTARLIMLGDKDQLAAVEAGSVLGDICHDSQGYTPRFRQLLQQLTGESIPAGHSRQEALADCIVLLKHSYRFGAESGIGQLARAVNRGYASKTRQLLGRQDLPDISWWSLGAQFKTQLATAVNQGYRDYLEALQNYTEQPGDQAILACFAAFNQFRVLSALRHGAFGVEALNLLIEQIMQEQGRLSVRRPWYIGRPIMITRNDYDLQLFNGDIGLALFDTSSRQLRVVFQTGSGRLKPFPVSRLPSHETVFAMTVHKSQGSEFDQVLLLLPPRQNQVISRELLYTGITRARHQVSIWGREEGLKSAVQNPSKRHSGLAAALWDEA